MNVVVIVLSNYISSRNREMLTTTNERDTVITLKQKQRVVKALSRARALVCFLSSLLALKVLSYAQQQQQ